MKIVFAIILAIVIAGCSSVGTPISQDKVNQIRVGITTEADSSAVRHAIDEDPRSSGAIVLTWVYSSANTKPETFVPLAGPFIGGYQHPCPTANILVDRKGRVERWTMNNAPGEVRYGRRR